MQLRAEFKALSHICGWGGQCVYAGYVCCHGNRVPPIGMPVDTPTHGRKWALYNYTQKASGNKVETDHIAHPPPSPPSPSLPPSPSHPPMPKCITFEQTYVRDMQIQSKPCSAALSAKIAQCAISPLVPETTCS